MPTKSWLVVAACVFRGTKSFNAAVHPALRPLRLASSERAPTQLHVLSKTSDALVLPADDDLGNAPTAPSGKDFSVSPQSARVLLGCVAALYGTNFGCVKILEGYLPPSLVLAGRFSLATAVLLPMVAAKNQPLKSIAAPLVAGAEIGLWCAFAYAAQALGLETSSAGKSAFVCSLCVLVVPFLEAIDGRPPPLRIVLAAIVAVFGVALLELGDQAAPGVLALNRGDALSLLQPLFFGIGFWRTASIGRKFPDDALALTVGQVAFVALVTAAWAFVDLGAWDPVARAFFVEARGELGAISASVKTLDAATVAVTFGRLTREIGYGLGYASKALQALAAGIGGRDDGPLVAGSLFWVGIVSTAATNLGETVALTSLEASEATLIFATEPMWGAAFAYATLHETLGPMALAGGGLIIATCVTSSWAENRGKV